MYIKDKNLPIRSRSYPCKKQELKDGKVNGHEWSSGEKPDHHQGPQGRQDQAGEHGSQDPEEGLRGNAMKLINGDGKGGTTGRKKGGKSKRNKTLGRQKGRATKPKATGGRKKQQSRRGGRRGGRR